jgi:hypothetical protein
LLIDHLFYTQQQVGQRDELGEALVTAPKRIRRD